MQQQFSENQDPKTLIIDFSKGYGGASSRVLSLLQNIPVGQVALAGLANSQVIQAAIDLGVPVYIVGTSKLDLRILKRLANIIRNDGYQVIDTHNIQAKFWGSLAASISKAGLVSTIHSWYAHEHGKKSLRGRLYTWLELRTNHNLSAYITVSQKDHAMLIQSGIPDADIELIYNAVSVDTWKIPDFKEQFQTKLGIPESALICTAVGRLVAVKGYDVLIDAFHIIAAQIPNLYCVILGDGELYQEHYQRVQELGLDERVKLLGYCDHATVLSIVKSSDIFVMPSRYEGTPIALLEAAALGKAIVASQAGGIPELVTDGEHAILVPPEDPIFLADTLIQLAQDQEKINMFGEQAQRRVQKKFTLERMVERTRQTYLTAWNKKLSLKG